MPIEVKVPTFPESVTDGTIISWRKNKGDLVTEDEIIAEIETDKVVFEVPAPDSGIIKEIIEAEGEIVASNQPIANIDNSKSAKAKAEAASGTQEPTAEIPASSSPSSERSKETLAMPAAQKMMSEQGISAASITGSGKGGRILKEDVIRQNSTRVMGLREEKRVPMTRLRKRIAERLVDAQHTAAILTTFNEINMQPVIDLRTRYRDIFEKKHGVRLGFMAFFVKACVEALRKFPEVNASVDGDNIVYHGFYDIGIAVGSPRGLVVPILRDTNTMDIATIEKKIRDYGARAQTGKLELDEITGGTFSITNGGVFGSLLSTPILNPPQSAILGMHKIQERPMAENGQVVIRPMMYLALSYDHRIVDGREAVQFLVTIKDLLEDPARILLDV